VAQKIAILIGIVSVAAAGLATGSIAFARAAGTPYGAQTTTALATTTSSLTTLTLMLSLSTVEFGKGVTLRGAVRDAAAGQPVQIMSQSCGFTTPVQIATVKTAGNGAYTFTLMPARDATFSARSGGAASPERHVGVRPAIVLKRVGARAFAVELSVGAGDYFTKNVTLERYEAAKKLWRPLASGSLHRKSDIGALIAVSATTIHATVKPGTRVRASVGSATLGQCYRPGYSAVVTA
jgi:hypothetical protein